MTPLDRPVPRTLRSQPLFPLTVAWLALGLSAGCGSGGPGGRGGQVGDPCDASRPCRSDLVCGTNGMCVVDEPPPDQGVVVLPDLGPGVTITGIELTPVGETADLTIGATDTVQFSAVLRRSDSQTLPATGARFTASSRVLGTLDTVTGAFALNGLLGGSVTVTVSITIGGQTFTDTETLVVNLSRTIGGGAGGPTDPVTQFMGTPVMDAARTAAIQYPLDEVVMPQNVSPADVQWSCGANTGVCPEADSFRITLEKPHARVVVYVRNPDEAVNDHYLVDASAWRALAQSDPTDAMSVRVDRFDAAATQVVSGAPIDVNFAVAAVTGTVYYWDIDDEKIRRINDGAPASELLLPHPDSPLADDVDGDACVGCHAISNSGRYMLANLHFDNFGALYDLTRSDLAANPAPTEWPVSEMIRWRTASFSPDDTRAMVSSAQGNDFLFLIDPFTGQSVTHTGTLPNPGTHPAWSRDGDSVAYIGNTNSWAGDITTGDLSMLPVTGPDAFGPGAAIHTGASLSGQAEGGVTDSYPTWSPDSAWLAFAHGTGSRSDPRDPDGNVVIDPANTSAIYLVRRDGTGLTRLTRIASANHFEFQPNFSPFTSGGYYWLSYLSRRPYGNRTAGNAGTTIQPGQVWVTAVRANADGTFDPSGVPYWLPGQIPDHRSVSAFWAPRACRVDGEGCMVNSECCGGVCGDDGSGGTECVPPPVNECRLIGETCSTNADCCDEADGATCTNNSCVNIIFE
ncbi:MAG: hypothetical protein KBB95_02975 [Deltaproteobacteria bacterium]|nr:hypothetical protein [Deltaproteobacteria bacterium]